MNTFLYFLPAIIAFIVVWLRCGYKGNAEDGPYYMLIVVAFVIWPIFIPLLIVWALGYALYWVGHLVAKKRSDNEVKS